MNDVGITDSYFGCAASASASDAFAVVVAACKVKNGNINRWNKTFW